jgi:hypothetical protein
MSWGPCIDSGGEEMEGRSHGPEVLGVSILPLDCGVRNKLLTCLSSSFVVFSVTYSQGQICVIKLIKESIRSYDKQSIGGNLESFLQKSDQDKNSYYNSCWALCSRAWQNDKKAREEGVALTERENTVLRYRCTDFLCRKFRHPDKNDGLNPQTIFFSSWYATKRFCMNA